MNEICKNCDTRCRLKICDGKSGDFKYCFRRVGSTNGLADTITPFNTLHELYEKQDWLDWIIPESLVLDDAPYGGDNMVLLFGKQIDKMQDDLIPIGFVTVLNASKMEKIKYEDEK